MEKEVAKKTKSKGKLISKIITGIFATLVLILLISQVVGAITSKNNYGVPNLFGKQILVILTDSMEPAYKVDEAIFVNKVDLKTLKASTTPEAKDGDTITFYDPQNKIVITHRIIEVIEREDGGIDFRTLGDNLNAQTCLARYNGPCTIANADYVKGENVLGVVVGKSAFYGQVINATKKPETILIVSVIPLIFVFASSVADIIKISKMSEEEFEYAELDEFEALKQQEKLKLLIEIEKEKLRKELEANNIKEEEETQHGER